MRAHAPLLLLLLLRLRLAPVRAWTTLAQSVRPAQVVELFEGTRIGPLGSFYGGLGYVWSAEHLRDLTWAVDHSLCDGWPLPVAGNGTCAQAVNGVVGLAFEQLGLGNYARNVDAQCRARSASGRVEVASCSSEAGGPARIVLSVMPASAGAAARTPPLAPREHEQVARVQLTTLAVAYVYAAPRSDWIGTRDARPRYADGSPHPVLATTAAVIEFSPSQELSWCAADAEDAAAGACAAHAEAQTTRCIEGQKAMLHEMGHALGLGHPIASSNFKTDDVDSFAIHHWAAVRAQPDEAPAAIMRAVIDSSMPPEPTADDLEGLSTLYPGLWTNPRTLLGCDPVPHSADDDDDDDGFNTNSQDPIVWDLYWLGFWVVFAACWLLLCSLIWGAEDYYARTATTTTTARFVQFKEDPE